MVFVTYRTQFDLSKQFYIIFGMDPTYTIGHIIVLFDFRYRLHWV